MKSYRSLLTSTLRRRSQQRLYWLVLIGIALLYIPSQVVFAGPITPTTDKFGNVTWGPPPLIDPSVHPILDSIPGQGNPKPPAIRNGSKPDSVSGTIVFFWSDGYYIPEDSKDGKPVPHMHSGYGAYTATNNGDDPVKRVFQPPQDPTITDWHQSITINWSDGTTSTSKVEGGAIQHNRVKEDSNGNEESNVIDQHNSWAFFALDQLPDIGYKIPDLAPSGGNLTIYTAVDLLQYETHNPLGFLGGDYQIGQTIDQLGINVVNGQISGLEGIYFSTTPFTFDPNSATGYVPEVGSSGWLNSADFESANGPIYINGIHDATTPEPSSLSLLGIGTVFLLGLIYRRRKQVPA